MVKQRSSRFAAQALPTLLSMLWAILIVGCQAAAPTSITLYHPKTKVWQTCAARQTIPKYTEAIAAAVEACAKQLEARGFVRVDRIPDNTEPGAAKATVP
ncbi:MAG TPA: hypothetical protein VNO43_07365 [Candidatus Eisenbacteria bacterium]|nr:hypothetical protein [Candidatus Eisenbacteria bacterium]